MRPPTISPCSMAVPVPPLLCKIGSSRPFPRSRADFPYATSSGTSSAWSMYANKSPKYFFRILAKHLTTSMKAYNPQMALCYIEIGSILVILGMDTHYNCRRQRTVALFVISTGDGSGTPNSELWIFTYDRLLLIISASVSCSSLAEATTYFGVLRLMY